MSDLIVHPQGGPLRGSVPVPSDKSVGHRALLFASLAEGRSEIRRFSYGEDNVSTLKALAAMGVDIRDSGEGTVEVFGRGLFGLSEPHAPLDCGNSGTTMRLFSGLLAPQHFRAVLVGDESLSRRPMARVANPLRRRGARIEGVFSTKKPGEITAPLTIGPLPEGHLLCEIEHELPVATAQVKSALLISGLYADGVTRVREPELSRDHTERMMRALEVPLRTMGPMVELDPAGWNRRFGGFSIDVPGDISAAAFVLVAGCIVPGSLVSTRDTGLNPTRTGILDALRQMGATVHVESHGETLGEPQGELQAAYSEMRGGTIAGELVTRAIDEVPILCVLAARARGVTHIADAGELRVKESDRIAEMTKVLRSFGISVEEHPDGMSIEGQPESALTSADVDCHGDHRIAMSSAILGLLANGTSRIRNVDCIATSFPKFVATLRGLGAHLEVTSA